MIITIAFIVWGLVLLVLFTSAKSGKLGSFNDGFEEGYEEGFKVGYDQAISEIEARRDAAHEDR